MTEAPWKQIDFGQQRWWVDPNWSQQLLDQDGLRLQQWRDQGQVEIIKHSEQRTVYRIGLPNKSVFIKHYPARDLRSRLRLWLRQAKAWIEWQRTIELKQRAVPTITPVAVGMHPEHGSYFITEEIPSAYPLHSYVQEHWHRCE